ncbi:MAG: F0F1 ATP synthase subunit alpha, partial [Armatimonadetes bacterium]
ARAGQRLTELLKQGLHVSYPVDEQVVAIFAGTSGFLDGIPNDKVTSFEEGLLSFVKDKYPEALESIRTTKEVSKEIEETLKKACAEFAESFGSKK